MQTASAKGIAVTPTASAPQTAPPVQPSLWSWFHPINWLAGFVAFGVSLATYVFTLQPTVGLEDSGELITAAFRLGVPHPPGYPIWTLLGKLFTFIPIGDVAYRVNLLSAVCGALSAGCVTLVLAKTGDFFFNEQEKELGTHHLLSVFERFGLTTPRLVNSFCAIAAGILFAYTPGTWSQSTIAEVYSLNSFFMALLVVLSLVLMFNPQRRFLFYLISFFFAVGITTHQTIAVMGASLLWLLIATSRSLEECINLIANAAVLLAFTLLMFYSQRYFGNFGVPELRLLPFDGGIVSNFFVGFIGPFIVYLVVAYFINKQYFQSTEWVKLAGAFFLGLSVYFYLPIASVTNPQMNWGRPRTVEGFWHSILRGQYEKPVFRRDIKYFVAQTWLYLKDTWDQYPLVLIFAFISVIALIINWRRERVRNWLIYTIITFVACGVGMVFLMNPKLDITSQYINRVFFIMGHAGLGLLVGYGMMVTAAALIPLGRSTSIWRPVALVIGALLTVYGVVFMLCGLFGARVSTGGILAIVANSVSVPHEFRVPFYLIYGGIFAVIGLLIVAGLLATRVGYVASVIIAVLLLSTPGISAIENWAELNLRTKYFGYVFGIEMLKVCEPGTIFFGGTDPGRFVPEYLIGCNEFRGDIWLITQNGLADATYMNVLRDRYCKPQKVSVWARRLLRTLHAEREDPERQDRFTRDPKLGTIYIPSQQDFEGAFQEYIRDVEERRKRGEPIEEDVQIVGGKISVGGVSGVMRLNGILARMIFAQNTNKHAFYVEESYVIPWMYPYLEPAGLIMKLNKDKVTLTPEKVERDFEYWNNLTNMFASGGQIEYDDIVALYWHELKDTLQQEPTAPREAVVSQCWSRAVAKSVSVRAMPLESLPSRDYLNAIYEVCKTGKNLYFAQERGRIVIKPGEFKDDEPAQKSFSKARSASAGVYEHHQMWKEAENAYRQAIWLYPKSAEAYMRLASMYVRQSRFDDALELAEEYKRMDPLNDRVDGMISVIREQRDQNRAFLALQQRVAAGTNTTWNDYVQLAQVYEQQNNHTAAAALFDIMLDSPALTNIEPYQYMLSVLGPRQDIARVNRIFERLVQLRPNEWSFWLDWSFARFASGDIEAGFGCLDKALELDREKSVRRLAQDPRFAILKSHPDEALRNRFLKYLE